MQFELLRLMEKKHIATYHVYSISRLLGTIEKLTKIPSRMQGLVSGFVLLFVYLTFRIMFEDKIGGYLHLLGTLVCTIVSAILGWFLINAAVGYPVKVAKENLRRNVYPYSSLYSLFMKHFVSSKDKSHVSFQELERRNRVIFEPRTQQ